MIVSPELNELATALCAAQAEFEAIDKSADNPFFKSKYAPLPEVVKAATPILAKHGLAVSQLIGGIENDDTLTTMLLHKSGQYIADTMRLRVVPDKQGNLTPQAQGSASTYARRYALMAVLGLVADEDDDGNAASKPAKRGGVDAKGKPLADQVAALPGTVELAGPKAVKAIKDLRAEVGLSPAALKAHVVATHSKDSLEALTPDEAEMVRLWLAKKQPKAA